MLLSPRITGGSVKNGCISNSTYLLNQIQPLTFAKLNHETMILGRVTFADQFSTFCCLGKARVES